MLGKVGHVRPEHSLRSTGDGHDWMCCGEAQEAEFSHHSVLWDPGRLGFPGSPLLLTIMEKKQVPSLPPLSEESEATGNRRVLRLALNLWH